MYVEVAVEGEGIEEFQRALAATHVNGGVQVRRFRWEGDKGDWFNVNTNLTMHETFRTLLESNAARQALPDVLVPSPFPIGSPPDFWPVAGGALRLEGDLATALALGGAYKRHPGTDRDAKDLARRAERDLIGDRYEDFRLFASDAPWSPWFFDVAWDQTWILVDRGRAEVTIICATDTD